MPSPRSRLFVCYVPSLDRRRVGADTTPFVHRLLADFPAVRIRTQPTTELFPTLVTGTYPGEHGIWQVSLRDGDDRARAARLIDALPDGLTTTWQCLRHLFDPAYDLPAVPPRRRRHFRLHRLKYTRRRASDEVVRAIGGVPSLFGLLGDRARYSIHKDFRRLPRLVERYPDASYLLDLLEFYALDLFCHWNLDRPQAVADRLRRTDRLIEELHRRCREAGVLFLLLVDHGQEPVSGSVDLRPAVGAGGVPRDEYLYFVDVVVARFWFASERARAAIGGALAAIPGLRTFTREELEAFDFRFADDRFGQLFAVAPPGSIFFPHDFYQPLANLFRGLSEPAIWPRLTDPRHRGYHGGLPDHPAEEGFMVLADRRYGPRGERMELIDFAPTVLELLGRDRPPGMRGRPALRPAAER